MPRKKNKLTRSPGAPRDHLDGSTGLDRDRGESGQGESGNLSLQLDSSCRKRGKKTSLSRLPLSDESQGLAPVGYTTPALRRPPRALHRAS
eukprot:COSAG06_NODE_7546_length_2463_cov_3.762690_1_plen_91_part_00